MKIHKSKFAFTLVEMMIVLSIVAMLAVLAIPHLLRVKASVNQTNAKAVLKAVGSALEAYALDHDRYPSGPAYLIGEQSPYLTTNYFEGEHCGYTFFAEIEGFSYVVTATPVSEYTGTKIFTMTTGSVITEKSMLP